MVELHVFGIEGNIKDYRDALLYHLGYRTKMSILIRVKQTGKDIIPEVPDEVAIAMIDELEFSFDAEVALVFEEDPITKTL